MLTNRMAQLRVVLETSPPTHSQRAQTRSGTVGEVTDTGYDSLGLRPESCVYDPQIDPLLSIDLYILIQIWVPFLDVEANPGASLGWPSPRGITI